jgi:hypothetical protein
MSISGISSNSLLYDLFQTSSKESNSSSSGFELMSTDGSGDSSSNTIGADLSTLLKALESGNISTAQSSFSQLMEDVQSVSSTDDTSASTSSISATSEDSNPLAKDMSDLEDAISSGDLTGAQSILANIMQHMQMQGPPPPPPVNESTSTSENSDSLSSDLSELGDALSSGDTSGAQTILEQIIAKLQTTGTSSSDDESTSTSSTSGTSTDTNPLAQDLSKLEDALSSGDTTSAQSIFANIMQHMQGPPPPPPASESASTDSVASTSSSSSLSNNFSTLLEALSSGDLTSAQSSFSQLLEDLQSTSSTDSSSNSTASTSDTSTSNFSLQLGKLLETWASLMGTNTQTSTTNIFA